MALNVTKTKNFYLVSKGQQTLNSTLANGRLNLAIINVTKTKNFYLMSRGQQTLNSTLANGRTVVESRYHNFGLDSEIRSQHGYTLKYL